MVLVLAGCVFIDDAEHAAFVATLGDDGADTGDTGDSGDTGAPAGFPGGGVAQAAAGFSVGQAQSRFGASVLAAPLDDRGPSLVASLHPSAVEGESAWAWDVELAERGTLLTLDAPDAGRTEAGVAVLVQGLGVAPDASTGERRLVTASLGARVEAWSMRASGEGSSLGTMEGEAVGDVFGAAILPVGERTGLGAPGIGCGAAYVVDWPTGAGTHTDVATRYQDGGRKLVPPDSCLGDRFGAALAAGRFDTGQGLVVGAPMASPAGLSRAGQAWVFLDVDAPDDDGVIYAADVAIRLDGESDDAQFGVALAVLDLDDDGKDDLAVGSPTVDDGYRDSGQVYIYLDVAGLASGSAPTDAHVVLRAETDDARFGSSLAAAGADGRELVVGAPGHGDGAGALFHFRGEGLQSETAMAGATRLDGEPGTELGATLSSTPELPGVLAGAPLSSAQGATEAGVAWWWW